MKALLFISFLLVAGCGSLNVQKDCSPVDGQDYIFVCKKLGWFE